MQQSWGPTFRRVSHFFAAWSIYFTLSLLAGFCQAASGERER